MILQILLFLALIAAAYFVSIKKVVEELGRGDEAVKLGTGLAQMVVSFFVFFISAEDETLLEWRLGDLSFLYYLARYGFLFDALYGLVQVFAALFASSRGSVSAGKVKNSKAPVAVQGEKLRTEYQQPVAPVPGQIPTWKRIQMEEEKARMGSETPDA